MADWPTISALATAGGTLILAVATFASVRSANKAARTAERALQVGLRPVLVPSRLEDPPEKIRWGDGRWTTVQGGRAFVDESEDNIFLALSLRNVGAGIAVIQAWHADANLQPDDPLVRRILSGQDDLTTYPPLETFRRQSRDLFIPPNDSSFWQGRLLEENDETFPVVHDAVSTRATVTVYLLYSDHEGGQRAVSLFLLSPGQEGPDWISSVIRHWNLDRPDPR